MPNTRRVASSGPASMGIQKEMGEATRLTKAGRLMEATGLIQRTLGNTGSAGGVFPVGRQDVTGQPAGVRRDSTGFVTRERTNFEEAKRGFSSPLGGKLFDIPQSLTDLPTGSTDDPRIRVPEPPTVDTPVGGRFVSGSFTNGAGTRGYKLYIPGGLGGKTVPLLVMLHGCTQNPDDLAVGTAMNELAEEGKFLVVYPEQSQGANMQKCWNWFQAEDQLRDRGEPSIIAGITHQIAATQPVDTRRIFVAGMSAGGAMAVVMGETYPDLYAAVGVHSGLPYGAARDMPSAFQAMQRGGEARDTVANVPTIVFHGDRDATVNHRNGQQVLRQWTDSGFGIGGADAKPLVTVKKGQIPDGHAYTRYIYHDAGERTLAEGWTIHGAGHAWSGGDPQGSYTDARGPDASVEMVRFFLEHPRG